jgi:hypothetical protein
MEVFALAWDVFFAPLLLLLFPVLEMLRFLPLFDGIGF